MPQEPDGLNADMLWHRYQKDQDTESRTTLIEYYRPLNQMIAASLYSRRTGDDVEFEEYVQFGIVGLIEAVDRYQIDKGVPFEAYAKHRIRGAILNGLKKMSEKREQFAYRSRLRRERMDSISGEQGANAQGDLFEEMVEVALGMAISYMLEGTGLIRHKPNVAADNAYQAHELSQLRDRLIESTNMLPERERFIIEKQYFEGESFTSIARVMGVSKGRVSQLHKRALNLLRRQLVDNQSLDGYY